MQTTTTERLTPSARSRPAMTSANRASAVLYLIAAVALGFGIWSTSGLWTDLRTQVISGNLPDAVHYTWWLGHTPHAVGEGASPFVTREMNWPRGVNAMNNTTLLLPALLLSPWTALAGPLATLNLLNLAAVPACFAAGFWALRRLPGGPGGPAAVGAACFAISPAIVNSLTGHVTMAFAPGLPLLIGLSIEAWRTDRTSTTRFGRYSPARTGSALAVVALLQLFIGEEILFQAVLGAAIIAVVAAFSCPDQLRPGAKRLSRCLAFALAIFLPLAAYPLRIQFFGPLRQRGSPFGTNYFAADLTAFATPAPGVLLHSAHDAARSALFPGRIEEHLAYLGWPLILTCVIISVLGRRSLGVRCATAGLVVSTVLSLGGTIWYNGSRTNWPGPYAVLQALPVTEGSLASRFGVLAALFSAALLAIAIAALQTGIRPHDVPASHRQATSTPLRTRSLTAALVAAVCLAPLLPARIPTTRSPQTPAFFTTTAQHLPLGTTALVLPFPSPIAPQGMLWQAASGYRFRMLGGYFLGPDQNGDAAISAGQSEETKRPLWLLNNTSRNPNSITDAERALNRAELNRLGVDIIVLGPGQSHDATRSLISTLLLRQPRTDGGVDVRDLSGRTPGR